jgi:PAS domain S-box-containing protein/excisionase family DNA binding protein
MTLHASPTAALTITEVARRLGVHPKTIYRLVVAGRLPAVKVGRVWRVPLDALAGYEAVVGNGTPENTSRPALAATGEGRYRALWEHAQDILYTVDLEGRLTDINRAGERLTGYTRGELLGRPIAELLVPPSQDTLRHALARKLAGEPNATSELVLRTKDGRELVVEVSSRLLYDAAGRPVGVQGSVRDLTDQVVLEAALTTSREEIQTILTSVAEGILVQGPDGSLRYANDAAAQFIGFPTTTTFLTAPVAEILSRFRVFDVHGAPLAPEQLPGALARRSHQPVERVLRAEAITTGEVYWLQVRTVPVFDEAGGVRFTVTAFQDITELRHGAEADQRLAAIVTDSTDAIVSKTLEGIVTSWNASAERMFGYTAEEMIGQPILRLFPPERQSEEDHILARLRAGERVEHFETVRVTKDGRRRDVSLTISPVRDRAGTIIGASKIARDITRQKQLEAERALLLEREQAAREAAQQALAVRDEFLGSVSHDLRTPLTTIRGLAQLLARQLERLEVPQQQRLRDEVSAIDRAAATMLAMVEELLDLTRLEAGQPLELRREAVDLVALAQAGTEESGRTAPRHQIMVTAAVPVLVGVWDRQRLERVLANLLSNAVKYSPDGGPVAVQVRPIETPDGPWAELTVTDHGIGIPAQDVPFVFERFRRGANVTGRVTGAGLGLAGVRRIVEYHGGTITLTSEEGTGTTVTVRLPLAEPRAGGEFHTEEM